MLCPTDNTISLERLKTLVSYDPETGLWTRLQSFGKARTRWAGKLAGESSSKLKGRQYVRVNVCGISYQSHRLAWFYMTGKWPTALIDHKNLDRRDNRWANLRDSSHGSNLANSRARRANRSGFKGVFPRGSRFMATIGVGGKSKYLGTYATAEEASAAYGRAALEHFGEFARS